MTERALAYWYIIEGLPACSLLPSALLQALNPGEACAAFDYKLERAPHHRARLLRRVCADMAKRFQPFHRRLVESLLEDCPLVSGQKASSYASFLRHFFPFCPDDLRQQILSVLLFTDSRKLRRTGLKCVRDHWVPDFNILIEEAWTRYADPEAGALIVCHFPEDFIKSHFEKLLARAASFAAVSKLFLKFPQTSRKHLDKLKELDRITYVYVYAESGLVLSDEDARSIYLESEGEERIGLLLWSLGRMGKWEFLLEVASIEQPQ